MLSHKRSQIEPDAAFTRRWQPVLVQEPSEDAALACLHGLRPRYEAHHSVVITDAALQAAVRCAKRCAFLYVRMCVWCTNDHYESALIS